MSYFSFRFRSSFGFGIYDLTTQSSRLHSERAMLAAIRKHDPFQDPARFH